MKAEHVALAEALCPNAGQEREWRELPGFDGAYLVSGDGHVVSLPRSAANGSGKRRVPAKRLSVRPVLRRGKPMSYVVRVSHPVDGARDATVAALMLEAFVGPADGRIAHIRNGDPSDLRLDNLEWSTFSAIAKTAPVGYSRCFQADYVPVAAGAA